MSVTVSSRGQRLRANGALLLASALWGFAFVAQRVGADHVGPLTFTGVRFAIGSAVLIPVILLRDRVRGVPAPRRAAATRAVLVPGMVAGVFLTIAVNLQQAAMADTPAGNAAFITGLYMVFVPVIAAFRGHRSSPATILGVLSSLAGLYLISVSDALTIGTGELLLILTCIPWAIQILVIEHYSPRLSALRFAVVQFLTCAVLSSLAALVLEPAPFTGLDQAVVPLLYGGLVSVGIAFTLQVVGQRHALATHASLIMATESVFGAIGGAILLGENMGLRGYAGAALMIVGIVVSQLGLPAAPLDDLADAAEPLP
ncbi:putative cystine transporter YijE [Propionicimonas sp. T2.31MG-18]|uniref:DMT family transporter n=1 Tax=Propionicimonas sp. T2.31MG-18 TaxID=3157620 RepID=UPI0035EF0379